MNAPVAGLPVAVIGAGPVGMAAAAQRADTAVVAARDDEVACRGLLGDGGAAASQGALVAARARRLARANPGDGTALLQLDRLFNRVDARLAEVIEHGVAERLYFLRVKLPRVTNESVGLVNAQRARYVPINSPIQSDLIDIVRTRLRPPPIQPRPPTGARQSRLEFEAAITHRPEPRGAGPAVSL